MSDTSSPESSAPAAPGATPPAGAGGAARTEAARVSAEAIVSDQHAALVAQYADGNGNLAEIACSDRGFMEERGRAPAGPRRGQVVPLPNRDIDDAFVFVGADDRAELWARPDYGDYAGLFDIFTETYYGAAFSKVAGGGDWNVDHMFPRTAGELKRMKYVRLTAIDARSNQLMGATIESQMAKREREADAAGFPGRLRPVLKATPFTLGKLTAFHDSIKLPRERGDFADAAVTQRLAVHVLKACRIEDSAAASRLFEILTRRSATTIQTPLNKRAEKHARFDAAHADFLRGE